MCTYVCLNVFIDTTCILVACGGQRALDSPGVLELQVVSNMMWVLGTEPRSSVGALCPLEPLSGDSEASPLSTSLSKLLEEINIP